MFKGSAGPPRRRKPVSVMSTGIEAHDRRLAEDEGRAQSLARRDLTLIRALCEGFRGDIVGGASDGILATFVNAEDAVECAQEVQRQFAESARVLPGREVLSHRIGLHLGEVRVSNGELLGDGARVATAVQGQASPGGICISQAFYDAIRRRLALHTTDLGLRRISPEDGEVQVYQVATFRPELSRQGEARARQSSSAAQRVFAVLGIAGIVLVGGAAFVAIRNLHNASTADGIPMVEVVDREPESEPPAAVTPAPLSPRQIQPRPAPPASPMASPRSTGKVQPVERSSQQRGSSPVSVPSLSDASGLTADEVEQFRELDFNRDGKLTRQEIPFELRGKIMWADADGDGAVTLEELKTARGRRLTQRRASGATAE